MSKPTQAVNLTDACTLAIAAGTAGDYKNRQCLDSPLHAAFEKLSLRFAELALEALGGEAGKGAGESAGV